MERRRDDGIGLDELAQATRNHGMPLEALRSDITPAGMHYVLIHYDVPFVEEASHELTLEGFDRPQNLSLGDLRSRPAVTAPVTFECAGNGRALFDVRPFSQPWLLEAVGTARWTGTPLAGVLRDVGVPTGSRAWTAASKADRSSGTSEPSRSTRRCARRSCWSTR
jgi:DMSO/TMAO reductase YedYZ molybdopterin-dependent catalytic subunit